MWWAGRVAVETLKAVILGGLKAKQGEDIGNEKSAAPPDPIPFPLQLLFEERLPTQSLAAFLGMLALPVGEVALIGVLAGKLPQAAPGFFHEIQAAICLLQNFSFQLLLRRFRPLLQDGTIRVNI